MIFQLRILKRNDELYNNSRFKHLYECDKEARNQDPRSSDYLFVFSLIQSSIFMILQFYLIYFGVNAIFHEHIIQIITLAGLNVGSAIYTVVQLLEVKFRVDRIQKQKKCEITQELIDNDNSLTKGFSMDLFKVDLPQIVVLSIFSIITIFITYRLYLQFGWSIYKKIGGDFKIQSECLFDRLSDLK
ncbi:9218_t:CDS:2 [Funneliformis caledonium]|uniref:9218_t:CDS:1 n=1 Tax=Funneliformis caledonium TaxID=1117310 RepID=A0A9N9A8P3_9GLOM|nr:9218_t:CDS:2 [Funneliformis caledonium]